MSGRRPSSPPLRSKTPNTNNNINNTSSSASPKHNNAGAAAAVAATDAVLAYFQRYKAFTQREYQQAFGITKLGEALLEGVLALRPEDPFPALAATCAEWHERAKQETLSKYGEILKSRSSSPVPFSRTGHTTTHHHNHNSSGSGGGLLGGGSGTQQQQRRARSPSAPQHPPAVPWAQATNGATKHQQGPALNRTHLTAASAAHESPQARRPLGGAPPRGSNQSNGSYPSAASHHHHQQQTMPFEHRDYIHRQRLTNIFDAWFCALVEAKPFSPALYSMNYFRQRCQMRKCVRSASPPTTGHPRSSADRDASPEPPSGSPSLSAPSSDTDRDDSPPAAQTNKNNKGIHPQKEELAAATAAAPPRGPISAFGLESAEHDAAAQNVTTPQQPAAAAEGGASPAAVSLHDTNPTAADEDDARHRLSPDYSAMGRGTLESPSPVLQTS